MKMAEHVTVGARHPLDPLTAEEIEAATGILKRDRGLADSARFVYVTLREPAKDAVIADGPWGDQEHGDRRHGDRAGEDAFSLRGPPGRLGHEEKRRDEQQVGGKQCRNPHRAPGCNHAAARPAPPLERGQGRDETEQGQRGDGLLMTARPPSGGLGPLSGYAVDPE